MMMNQSGFVLTEFLIAIAIAFGLTMLTFAMTFTLSTVEVVQYIVYSTSRAHAAANFDKQAQQDVARKKYEALVNSPTFKPIFSNGWFEVSKVGQLEIRSGNGENFQAEYSGASSRNNLQGVRTTFKAKILEMQLPFMGKVTAEDEDAGFVTKINAILIREVSMKECQDYFQKERPDALLEMDGNRFSNYRRTGVEGPWEDNGC